MLVSDEVAKQMPKVIPFEPGIDCSVCSKKAPLGGDCGNRDACWQRCLSAYKHDRDALLDTREAVIAKIKEIQEEARNIDDGITLTVCEDILAFIRNPKEA